MSSKKSRKRSKSEENSDTWIAGGLFAVIGLYVILTAKNFNDVSGGFFLVGFGIVFMAAVNEKFKKQVFDFFFSIFKNLWSALKKIKF